MKIKLLNQIHSSVFILLLLSLSLISCGDKEADRKLKDLSLIVSERPEEVLRLLDSIPRKSFNSEEAHYYDFLKLKAQDKAYITHTSDSVIVRLMDYYEKHDSRGLYPEVLYYGGRVYNDLGDDPTALFYFQKALELLPDNPIDSLTRDIKANVLSQTGRLLNHLCLYSEAVSYITKSIEIDLLNKDTINLVYDLQLLGATYLRAENYEKAEETFRQTFPLEVNLPARHTAKSKMYLAEIKGRKGEYDSALYYMKNIEKNLSPRVKNNFLAYISRIYLRKGEIDSAYKYSNALINSSDPQNREIGYGIILAPELRKFVPEDSLNKYLKDYRNLITELYDANEIQLAINQQNYYNYRLHEQKRKKAEESLIKSRNWLYGSIGVGLLLLILILYYKNKNKKQHIELHQALDTINRLNLKYSDSKNSEELKIKEIKNNSFQNTEVLRNRLKEQLLLLVNEGNKVVLSQALMNSQAYIKIHEMISSDKLLLTNDPLWNEISEEVLKEYPDFRSNLQLLTESNLTDIDYHTALLIKLQIPPSKMALLLGRTKSTIVSRRDSLGKKILGKKTKTNIIDALIRLM